MAASPALPILQTSLDSTLSVPSHSAAVIRTPLHSLQTGVGTRSVRRQITPRAGFALEILGHAIEYLADEYVLASSSQPSLHADDPQVQAMRLLMAANRQVYYACPVKSSVSERFRHWALRWMQ